VPTLASLVDILVENLLLDVDVAAVTTLVRLVLAARLVPTLVLLFDVLVQVARPVPTLASLVDILVENLLLDVDVAAVTTLVRLVLAARLVPTLVLLFDLRRRRRRKRWPLRSPPSC
jgi:hypothetical protein